MTRTFNDHKQEVLDIIESDSNIDRVKLPAINAAVSQIYDIIRGPRMSPEDKWQLIHGRNGLPDYEETRVFTPCPNCGYDISSCRESHQCVVY